MPIAHAAESFVELSSVTEDDFFTELPVVLHATRLQQSIVETPASMTVIDRQMIEASSATTIPELLRYVPGFQLTYRHIDHILIIFIEGWEFFLVIIIKQIKCSQGCSYTCVFLIISLQSNLPDLWYVL